MHELLLLVRRSTSSGSWFDKLTMSGNNPPLILSLSKDEQDQLF